MGKADFGDGVAHRSHQVTVEIPEPLSQFASRQGVC